MKTEDFYNKRHMSIFASYYKPHLSLFLIDMGCAFFVSMVDLAFPLISKYGLEQLLPGKFYRRFFILMLLLVAAYLLRSAAVYVVTAMGHRLGVLIEADMRRDIFSHLQTLSFSFYDKNRTGQLMSRVTGDLFEVTELAHHGPEDIFISVLTLTGSFIVMFSIQWRLAAVVLAMVPLTVLFAGRARKNMSSTSDQVKSRMADINADLESSISGMRVAKAFAGEQQEIEKFSRGNERFKSAKGEYYRAMGWFNSGMDFMMAMLNLLVIAAGGWFIMQEKLVYTELVTFTLYVNVFVQPVKRLVSFVEQYTVGMAGFRRFVALMRVRPDIVDGPDAEELSEVRGSVEFRNVSFRYDEGGQVLSHVSLRVEPGKMLAIVGPSGGGKSTLCQLIPRFYEAQEGSVRVDDRDVRDLTVASLRRHVGIVQQDVFLFAGTVADNIRYGRPDADEEEIILAAKQADIHEEIMKMPKGYDTYVGERGVMLSGGQRQRIGIARVFLKNPPILILDEATSALDSHTEARIQQSFDRLAKGRTTLVIAHRLSTIRGADQIIVLNHQGVAEQGTHEELLAANGEYASLWQSQFQ